MSLHGRDLLKKLDYRRHVYRFVVGFETEKANLERKKKKKKVLTNELILGQGRGNLCQALIRIAVLMTRFCSV